MGWVLSTPVTVPLAVTAARVWGPVPLVIDPLVGEPANGPPLPPPEITNEGAPEMAMVAPSGRSGFVRKADTSSVAEKLTGKVWPFSRNWGTELEVVQFETM